MIATAPFVDGRQELRRSLRQPTQFLQSTVAGLRDAVGAKIGRGHEVRLVDDPGEFAVLTAPGAKRAILDAVDRESDWVNRLPARIFLALPSYRPITTADEIRCPTLVIGGSRDQIVPAEGPEAAADRIPESTYIELPADHMSVFDTDFETVVGHQLTFLRATVDHRQ